jgi:hypothetical protein
VVEPITTYPQSPRRPGDVVVALHSFTSSLPKSLAVPLPSFSLHFDGQKALAYLETDKAENVRFYERFGFVTTSEALVLGTPNATSAPLGLT